MTEYATTIEMSDKPRERDWLAVLCVACVIMSSAGHIFSACIEWQVAQIRQLESGKASERADMICKQLATSTRINQLLINKYDPEHRGVHEWSHDPDAASPLLDR